MSDIGEEGSILDIWNRLFSGEIISMEIDDYTLSSFRSAIFRMKKLQEEALLTMDLLEESQVKSLSFVEGKKTEQGNRPIVMQLKSKSKNILYKFVSLKSDQAAAE